MAYEHKQGAQNIIMRVLSFFLSPDKASGASFVLFVQLMMMYYIIFLGHAALHAGKDFVVFMLVVAGLNQIFVVRSAAIRWTEVTYKLIEKTIWGSRNSKKED